MESRTYALWEESHLSVSVVFMGWADGENHTETLDERPGGLAPLRQLPKNSYAPVGRWRFTRATRRARPEWFLPPRQSRSRADSLGPRRRLSYGRPCCRSLSRSRRNSTRPLRGRGQCRGSGSALRGATLLPRS